MTDQASQPDSEAAENLGLDGFLQPADDDGLSLDELSQAYADLLKQGDDPYQPDAPRAESSPDAVAEEAVEAEEPEDDDDSHEVSPRSILEAILFVGTPDETPLTSEQVAALMRGVRPQEIDELVVELNSRYDAEDCPYKIVASGPGYEMVLREEFAAVRNKFYGRVKDAKLSQAAIDVLAVVAYNQPVTRDEVDKLRTKPSSSLLSQLVRRQLLAIQRPDTKPRTKQYVTTDRFLALFGLESLNDLPTSHHPDRL